MDQTLGSLVLKVGVAPWIFKHINGKLGSFRNFGFKRGRTLLAVPPPGLSQTDP